MKISSLLLAAGFTLFVPRAAAASENVPADTACTPAFAADAPTPYIIMCSSPMRNRQVIDSLLADAARREMPVVNGPMRSELEQPAAAATAWQPETIPTEAVPSGPADRYHLLQTAYMGVPLIAGGLLMQGADHHVRNMRYQYAANFHTSVDAYTQYLPAAVMLGLKAGGVESRSQWGRMLVSDAFSAAIMAVAVNTIKLTADVQRPDGSAYNSFPSGHTATAFMTATMLSREYGHKSPWVSYGSYGLATATGLMRILNNRHWISDVMAGAAIGYISTQLGYFLTDLIFKDKYLNVKDEADLFDARRDPSFLGISLSYDLPGVSTRMNNGHRLRTASGVDLALEGAKFINPYLGFGGRASLSDLTVMVNNQTSPNSLGMVGLYAGVFGVVPAQRPLERRRQIPARLRALSANHRQRLPSGQLRRFRSEHRRTHRFHGSSALPDEAFSGLRPPSLVCQHHPSLRAYPGHRRFGQHRLLSRPEAKRWPLKF